MAKFMLGSARHQLDDKGRWRIPAQFREGLGASAYILPGRAGSLYIVPESRFESVISSLTSSSLYANDDTNDLATAVMSAGGSLEEDAQGRVRIAPELLKAAGIKKEVVFVGKATYVEVWPAEVWDSRYSVLDPENLERIIERLKKFGV